MSIVFLGLGSNLGNREAYLCEARKAIGQEVGEIVAESSIYENNAIGFDGYSFLNQVIKIKTELLPQNLLQKIKEIEKKMGRLEKTNTIINVPIYANRILDIDILLYDDLQIDTDTLTIPHPKMYERVFVMKLLDEINNSILPNF